MAALLLTGLLRVYAVSQQIMDIPSHRSAHSLPVPRGGGLAFVLCFLGVLLLLSFFHQMESALSLALGLSGACIAALGFWDDRCNIPARWRLLGHFIAAAFALFCLGGMPGLPLFYGVIPAGFFLTFMALLYLVWLLNLYNFMDGIDGLAGIEALCACIGAVVIYWAAGFDAAPLLLPPLILAPAVAGFLVWNMPSARIFMGDAGSGFLGFTLGLMSIEAARFHPQFFWSWLILLGVFIVDASVTLLRRAMNGHKIWEAHCSHAYQHLARRLDSHFKVTMLVLGVNLFWLFPWAYMAGMAYMDGATALLIAYSPLLVLALVYRAGQT
ncbi:MAG: glycosyltransferase family 4 protein [Legionellaceae bacterium]|nr:glycosyltransferase family 4 protein [Legionellaceae bacterium]